MGFRNFFAQVEGGGGGGDKMLSLTWMVSCRATCWFSTSGTFPSLLYNLNQKKLNFLVLFFNILFYISPFKSHE